MSKALRKSVMRKSEDNWSNNKNQRNFFVNLLCKTKADFQKLNVKDLPDNKKLMREKSWPL